MCEDGGNRAVEVRTDGVVDFHRFDIAEYISSLHVVSDLTRGLATILGEEEFAGNRSRNILCI